jgi:hypothetical protein
MVDKNILKQSLNDRLKEIDEFVDSFLPNTTINNIINKYKSVLDGYEYIESVDMFSTLSLKGSMKYVNKFDGDLRYGGLLIKIYKKENNKWYAVIKNIKGRKYYVSFDANYIFYRKTNYEERVDLLKVFMSDIDSGMYEII